MTTTPEGRAQSIASQIRGEIRQGTLQPGDRLPSIAEYMDMYGVSLNTVRSAQSKLVEQGLLRTVQGVGVFVADDVEMEDPAAAADAALRKLEEASRDVARLLASNPFGDASESQPRIVVADPDDHAIVVEVLQGYVDDLRDTENTPTLERVARVRELLNALG
jgi:DNA-binding GntR family transcriptional regulator